MKKTNYRKEHPSLDIFLYLAYIPPMKEWISGLFSEQGFMPHIHCYLDRQSLVWTMFITNLLIGVAYLGISLTLWALIRKIKLPFNFVVLCFGVFIGACGLTHLLEVWTLWHPDYWIAAFVSVITAAASVGTAVYLFRLRHAIYTIAEASKLAEQRRLDLEVLTESLESRVRERTLELEHSKNQLNFITNALPTFVAKLDRHNCYVFVNDAYEKAFGIKRENIIGHHVSEIVGEKFYAKAEPLMQKTLRGEKVRYENSLTTKNGEIQYLDIAYIPEIDADGIVQGYVVLSHDITALKQSEDKLRFSEAKLKTILDSAPIGLCVADQNGHIEFLNQEGMRIWEGARYVDPNQYGEYQGWFLENETEVKITALKWPLARAVIYGESIIGQRIRIKTFEGNEKYIINSASPILGEDQKILGGVVAIQDITELRHYERQLQESEIRYRLLTEQSSQVIWTADAEGNITYANQTWYEYTGLSETETTQNGWITIIHPEDKERAWNVWSIAVERKDTYSIEMRLRRALDGTFRWFLVTARPIKNNLNAVIQWAGVCVDIHDLKLAQERIQESETKFRLYTEAMPQMAFIADSSGNISYYNSRHFDYFGVKRGDMEGWAWMGSKVYHPDDFDRTVATWLHALKTGAPYEIEYRLKRYDGQYRWHLGRAFPIRDSSGAISSWVGTNTDIHEQKEAQENMIALQLETEAARKELYEFFMQAPVPLCVLLGPEQTYTLANPLYEKLFGKKIPIGKPLTEVFSRKEADLFSPLVDLVYKTGKSYNGKELSITIPNEDGHLENHFLNITHHPLRDTDGTIKGVIAQVIDVTEQVIARQKMERLAEDLRFAINSRDEFLSIASHELKTPLTSLNFQTQLLQRQIEKSDPRAFEPERVQTFAGQTEKQVKRLIRLVDDMLDISRIRSGKLSITKELVDLCEIVEESIERIKLQFIQNEAPFPHFKRCEEAKGYWDKMRIEQVVNNLLTNALKYGNKKQVTIEITSTANSVRLSIRDEGIGITPDAQNRIFDRFERAIDPNEVSGLGLGLFITRQIVSAHGGRIWVESEPGIGSNFLVELPKK